MKTSLLKTSLLAGSSLISILALGCSTIAGEEATVVNSATVTPAALNPAAASNLKAFPLAEAGYQRYVISLPQLKDESMHQVSLVLGKQAVTDSVNHYFITGSVEPVDVPGWGYTYYKLASEGQMAGTLMAVPPSEPKVERFVEVNHQLGALPYNSQLPIVVIVPEGFEVKYRVWSAGELQDARKQ